MPHTMTTTRANPTGDGPADPGASLLLTDLYELNAGSRQELVHDKAKLYDIGGLRVDAIQKWDGKNDSLDGGH